MKKVKVKFAGVLLIIAITIFNWSLHLHHTEETKDIISSKMTKLLQYYYGPAIGEDLL